MTAAGAALLLPKVQATFAADGLLARALDGYEPREGQKVMAGEVATTLESGGTLLIEAGTGTGKTLGYLIPAILSGERVLVSTGTKNLQEQIYFKDLPALQQALGISFSATLMKGRSNYLCLHRFEMYRDGVSAGISAPGRLIDTSDRVLLPVVDAWARTTTTGDRAELRDLPEDLPMWKEIAAEADTCLGNDCPRYSECFVTRMRQQAAESDVVIVNHHLLCADAAVRQSEYGEVIPSCATLVVDEAHQLEDVATQYFGVAISSFRVDELVRDGARVGGTGAFGRAAEQTYRNLERVAEHARTFFTGVAMARVAETRARYTAESIAGHFEDGMLLAGALEALESSLGLPGVVGPDGAGGAQASGGEPGESVATLIRRVGELKTSLRFLMRASDEDFVYFIESRGRSVHLRASPIDVSRIVQDTLFSRMRAVVLTSATLRVDASFTYLKGRLGIASAREISVASDFDYRTQALLYLPRRMPPPRTPGFNEAVAREVTELLKRSRGRAFVLFTSYASLRSVQPYVEMTLPYPILVQGTAPRNALIEQFRSTPDAVLLATSSFWQGVDVVGDALSCVVIDKLPFASPGDPVTAARIEAMSAAGEDAFASYQVPLAILALQQGLGRLIRHRTDRGVLAVLDPRLKTMGYGRRFLASLPPAPVTDDLDAVERFFQVN
jgi:ATP-dependent DNA helicase DinG